MITIGIDPHKKLADTVAMDLAGHDLGQIRLPVRKDIGGQLLGWAHAWPDRQWAVEGATGLGRGVAQLPHPPANASYTSRPSSPLQPTRAGHF